MDNSNHVKIIITMQDESISIMYFITKQETIGNIPGWSRKATSKTIEEEIKKAIVCTCNHLNYWHKNNTCNPPEPLTCNCTNFKSKAKSWRIGDESEIPKDRTFRNALRDDGRRIYHHMPTVRQIHLNKLRLDREVILKQKDLEWMKATSQSKDREAKDIEKERQKLRDMPIVIAPILESKNTPEEVLGVTLADIDHTDL